MSYLHCLTSPSSPPQAVALGAAVHAGVLSGEVQGVRVLQAWQAELGRMLDGIKADTEE